MRSSCIRPLRASMLLIDAFLLVLMIAICSSDAGFAMGGSLRACRANEGDGAEVAEALLAVSASSPAEDAGICYEVLQDVKEGGLWDKMANTFATFIQPFSSLTDPSGEYDCTVVDNPCMQLATEGEGRPSAGLDDSCEDSACQGAFDEATCISSIVFDDSSLDAMEELRKCSLLYGEPFDDEKEPQKLPLGQVPTIFGKFQFYGREGGPRQPAGIGRGLAAS